MPFGLYALVSVNLVLDLWSKRLILWARMRKKLDTSGTIATQINETLRVPNRHWFETPKV